MYLMLLIINFMFLFVIENKNIIVTAFKNCFAHKDNFDFKSDHVFDKKKKYKSTVTNCIHFPFLLPFYKYHIRHGRTRLKVAF